MNVDLEKYAGTAEKFRELLKKTMADKSTELHLCRKINFGANGNLVRYQPVTFPEGTKFVNANVEYPNGNARSFKILGRNYDATV